MPKRKTKAHESVAQREMRDNNRNAIISEIKSMASKANYRLRQLERFDLTKASNAYRYIERRHFDKDSAISENRSGQMKFDTKLARKSMQQLVHEKRELERFLYEAKTSTAKGTISAYAKAYDTYMANHPGLNISRDKFGEIMNVSGMNNFLKFGSSQIYNLMKIAENDDISPEDVEAALAGMTEDTTATDLYREIQAAGRLQADDDGFYPTSYSPFD